MVKKLVGYKPLCFINKTLYFYSNGFIYKDNNNMLERIMRVYPDTWKDKTRLSKRLFRCEPKYAVPVHENSMLLVGRRKINLVDVDKRRIIEITRSRREFSDPLNICSCKGKWLAVWGDYGSNDNYESINIYGLNKDLTIEVVFSFETGKIRHIHNILPKSSGGYYIFTGDKEEGAGIYEADTLFKKVRAIKLGKQKYRAVVGFDTEKGLLYATDAVNERNYIYLLDKQGMIKTICELNGSCIYGIQCKNKYYFSTTVEPDENNKGLLSWLSRKRGDGILSNEVCLVELDDNLNAKIVLRYEKDAFPMKLMQYGSIQFPKGESEKLWCYPVAVKGSDGVAVQLY